MSCVHGGTNSKLCSEKSCDVCMKKSFVSHDKSKCWHTDNLPIIPRQVFKCSHTPYKFTCDVCGHEFTKSLKAISKCFCSHCSGTDLCGKSDCDKCRVRSVASVPDISDKLCNANPLLVPLNSCKYFHFKCNVCGHEFDATLSNMRQSTHKCKFCAGQELCGKSDCNICRNKSLQSYADGNSVDNKKKALCFSCNENKKTLLQVTKMSNKLYWFKCYNCNHKFETSPNRVFGKNRSWCPYCCDPQIKACNDRNCKLCNKASKDLHERSNNVREECQYGGTQINLCKEASCKICQERSFMSCDKSVYWHWMNLPILPRNVPAQSRKEFYFRCCDKECQHVFRMELCQVSRGYWCQYCANKILCNDENCVVCFNKSAASCEHNIVSHWSKNNEKSPRQVFKNGNEKYLFSCECGHETCATVYNIMTYVQKCLYCSGEALCGDEKCQRCWKKSFASNEKSKFWSGKNEKKPWEIAYGSQREYIFDCDVCKHEFTTSPNQITHSDNWCPYCAHKILCSNNECQYCYDNSFASYKKSKYWSSKNNVSPREIFKYANTKYVFTCEKGHEFSILISSVSQGNWCRACKYKTEEKLYKWLSKHYNNVEREKNFTWCINDKTNRYMPFDFYIEDFNVIIELDGRNHFMQVSNWTSPEFTQCRDVLKMRLALKNNVSVIRLLQLDVLNDTIDWKTELLNEIKIHDEPCINYIEIGNKYNVYKSKMNT